MTVKQSEVSDIRLHLGLEKIAVGILLTIGKTMMNVTVRLITDENSAGYAFEYFIILYSLNSLYENYSVPMHR